MCVYICIRPSSKQSIFETLFRHLSEMYISSVDNFSSRYHTILEHHEVSQLRNEFLSCGINQNVPRSTVRDKNREI